MSIRNKYKDTIFFSVNKLHKVKSEFQIYQLTQFYRIIKLTFYIPFIHYIILSAMFVSIVEK